MFGGVSASPRVFAYDRHVIALEQRADLASPVRDYCIERFVQSDITPSHPHRDAVGERCADAGRGRIDRRDVEEFCRFGSEEPRERSPRDGDVDVSRTDRVDDRMCSARARWLTNTYVER
jgi:hypothetical protein